MNSNDCVVVGGGPAGLVAGLMLARAGVRVTVCEKHADFLRDFRGDTVHASTLTVLDELGLGAAFDALPHRNQDHVEMAVGDDVRTVADFRRLPGAHRRIALVPQWDLLDLLAEEAGRCPGFTLLRRHEAVDVVRSPSRVTGVVVRGPDGREQEVRARLTLAADGRTSLARRLGLLPVHDLGAPIDVLWFRLPAAAGDVDNVTLRIGTGAFAAVIPREGYYQCGLVVPKGAAGALLTDGAGAFHRRFGRLCPDFAERVRALGVDDVRLLDVQLDRLQQWSAPGLLAIGDAAHAMSPVAGVGINLAVQDAVAAANLLAAPLRDGGDVDRLLPRVQWRRWFPTVVTQAAQRLVHDRVLAPRLAAAGAGDGAAPASFPAGVRALTHVPGATHLAGRAIAIGLLPEHVGPACRTAPVSGV